MVKMKDRVQVYLCDVTDVKNLGAFTKKERINEQKEHSLSVDYLFV